MNRERAKELLPVIRAFADGEDVYMKSAPSHCWQLETEPGWCDGRKYRIKPKPREFWIVSTEDRSDRYPHVLSPKEKEKHFADSSRYIKVREVIE